MSDRITHLDKVRIRSTGSYLPRKVVPNEALIGPIGTSSEWIAENLGILERRIAEPDEYTSDLAAQAGLSAIAAAGIDKNKIDLIILATSTPDRKCPSSACIAQAKMGITNLCPAFDLSAVCSGFLYAMTVAGQFLQSGAYECVLVIGADTFSKITDWNHRNSVFFGDGAGAVVLDRSQSPGGLFSSVLFADGTGMDNFTVFPGKETFSMNGRAVYDTATSVLPEAIRDVLCRNGLRLEDVAHIVPHQASVRVLKKTAEILQVPFSLIRTNLEQHANTAGATIPLLLDQVNRRGEIKPGDLVLFAAVGAGWTWGAALYRWI